MQFIRNIYNSLMGEPQFKSEDGEILYAAWQGNKNKVQSLLDAGVDVNATYLYSGFYGAGTALHVAAGAGHREIVDLLISRKADVNFKSSEGYTALQKAAGASNTRPHDRQYEIVQSLISAKAEVNAENNRQPSALTYAATFGNRAIVDLLISSNAKFNTYDMYGGTPLINALYNQEKNIDCLTPLLRAGADPAVGYITYNIFSSIQQRAENTKLPEQWDAILLMLRYLQKPLSEQESLRLGSKELSAFFITDLTSVILSYVDDKVTMIASRLLITFLEKAYKKDDKASKKIVINLLKAGADPDLDCLYGEEWFLLKQERYKSKDLFFLREVEEEPIRTCREWARKYKPSYLELIDESLEQVKQDMVVEKEVRTQLVYEESLGIDNFIVLVEKEIQRLESKNKAQRK